MNELGTIAVGLVLLIGLFGVVIPILPGTVLQVIAIAVWAAFTAQPLGWLILGIALLLALVGQVVKYFIPGRNLRRAGIPTRTMLIGGGGAVIGFFVIPVAGVILGFMGGIYLAERFRSGSHTLAWPATQKALVATGWSVVIELVAAMLIIFTWLAGVISI
ncbi:MAG: DUF456 domain-containing protein [Actinomycetota bacterium]